MSATGARSSFNCRTACTTLARIQGDVTLRIGRDGESYPGIRKDDVHVGGRITLVDAAGPFGNPTSDSARTMVTTATTRGLLVVFAPREVDTTRLTHVMDVTSERMQQFTGCAKPRAGRRLGWLSSVRTNNQNKIESCTFPRSLLPAAAVRGSAGLNRSSSRCWRAFRS